MDGRTSIPSFKNRNYGTRSSTQPTTKRVVDGDGPDFYPTPTWATEALLKHETFDGDIWECACGDGAMSRVLERLPVNIQSSDLYDRGFGESGVDFLTADRVAENIITNPPYRLAGEFALTGLQKSQKKLALLLRLAFLEGVERYQKIFEPNPPSRVWVFSERITFYPKNAERKGSGTTAYAWVVWDKQHEGASEICWITPGMKPGSRAGSRSA